MKTLKFKKGPIIVPLLLLILALAAYTVASYRSVSAAASLSVGQQYLNSLNYGGAIASFTKAIELDPSSRDARIGLADAYTGLGEYEIAQEAIEDLVYTERPDENATKKMADIMQESGQTEKAIPLVRTLIERTDKDEYYDLLNELMQQIYAEHRSLAIGPDYNLKIAGGQAMGQGSNVLGQLGIDPGMYPMADAFVACGFTGTPVKVAIAGRTSYIVDSNGALWAAGENRWGQMSQGYAVTNPQSGWVQVNTAAPVADVAGTVGRLIVLLTDGTVWTSGAGSTQSLEQIPQFSSVLKIASSQERTMLLTSRGTLYSSESETPDQWVPLADDVCEFSLSSSDLTWISSNGSVAIEGYGIPIPDTWTQDGDLYRPDFRICGFAAVSGNALCADSEGTLYLISRDGSQQTLTVSSPVLNVYAQSDVMVVECEDGSAYAYTTGSGALQDVSAL